MNWLANFIRPKIRSIVDQKEVPDNLWQKCDACDGMLFYRDLAEHMNVCYHCGHHLKIKVRERLKMLFDDGRYKELSLPKVPHDPLKFKDRKRYADRLRETRSKTGRDDAILIADGRVGGLPVVIAAFDFTFMGGSMGAAIGEAIVTASDHAIKTKAAFIVIPTSGGARMQEGMVSLMQMPRTIIAAERIKAAKLPYIVILTDPTTGGVSASFAMVGDIHIAEPGTTIGFAGKRVIQETIREELPEGFQTAEYLLEHGMIDMVVPRKEMRDQLIRILDLLLNRHKKAATGKATSSSGGGNSQNGSANAKSGKGTGKSSGVKAKAGNGKVATSAVTKNTSKTDQAANTNSAETPKKAAAK